MQRTKALFALLALIIGAIFFADYVERNSDSETALWSDEESTEKGAGD